MIAVRQAYANCVKMAAEDTLIEDKKAMGHVNAWRLLCSAWDSPACPMHLLQTALNMLGWIVSRADGAEFARTDTEATYSVLCDIESGVMEELNNLQPQCMKKSMPERMLHQELSRR